MTDRQDFTYDSLDSYFPYDGPHSRETVMDAARALPALVRYLNNATGGSNGRRTLEWAVTSYEVLEPVASMAGGLDQLLEQIASDLADKATDDDTLYDNRRSADFPASRTAMEADNAIRDAMHRLGQAAECLRQAAGLASRLGNE